MIRPSGLLILLQRKVNEVIKKTEQRVNGTDMQSNDELLLSLIHYEYTHIIMQYSKILQFLNQYNVTITLI